MTRIIIIYVSPGCAGSFWGVSAIYFASNAEHGASLVIPITKLGPLYPATRRTLGA